MRDGGVDERELLMCPVGRCELSLPEQLKSSLQRDGCSVLMAKPGTIYPPPTTTTTTKTTNIKYLLLFCCERSHQE